MDELVRLSDFGCELQVYKGQPARLLADNHNYLYPGILPEEMMTSSEIEKIQNGAWKNSMIEMFPVIGRLPDNTLVYKGKKYNVTPHGMPRAVPTRRISPNSSTFAVYEQDYTADTEIQNPKEPNGKPISLPFSYNIKKKFIMIDGGFFIPINLTNMHEKRSLIGDFGIHPSVSADHAEDTFITDKGHKYNLEEVIKASRTGAVQLEGATEVTHKSYTTGRELTVKSAYFNNMMLWSPGKVEKDGKVLAGMACIEPVTRLPMNIDKSRYLDQSSLVVRPGESMDFYVQFLIQK